MNGVVPDLTICPGNEDWFTFTVTSYSSLVTITARFDDPSRYKYVQSTEFLIIFCRQYPDQVILLNSGLHLVNSSKIHSQGSEVSAKLVTGQYFLKIYIQSDLGLSSPYTLILESITCSSDSVEPNNYPGNFVQFLNIYFSFNCRPSSFVNLWTNLQSENLCSR